MFEVSALTITAAFAGAWWGNRATIAPWWPLRWSSNPEATALVAAVAAGLAAPWWAGLIAGAAFFLYRAPGPYPSMLPPHSGPMPADRVNWRVRAVRWVLPGWYNLAYPERDRTRHVFGAMLHSAIRSVWAVAVLATLGAGLLLAGYNAAPWFAALLFLRGAAALFGLVNADARVVEAADGAFYGLVVALVFA